MLLDLFRDVSEVEERTSANVTSVTSIPRVWSS